MPDAEPEDAPLVWWCDECQAYECGWCGDFNSADRMEVVEHAATCPERPEKGGPRG
jgi:hypothetical protein